MPHRLPANAPLRAPTTSSSLQLYGQTDDRSTVSSAAPSAEGGENGTVSAIGNEMGGGSPFAGVDMAAKDEDKSERHSQYSLSTGTRPLNGRDW